MAHKRKDTLVGPSERWKHLRKFGKRQQAKAERRASLKDLKIGDVVTTKELYRLCGGKENILSL